MADGELASQAKNNSIDNFRSVLVKFHGVANVFNGMAGGGKGPNISMEGRVKPQLYVDGRPADERVHIHAFFILDAMGSSVGEPAIAGFVQVPDMYHGYGTTGPCPNFTPKGNVIGLRITVSDPQIGGKAWENAGFTAARLKSAGSISRASSRIERPSNGAIASPNEPGGRTRQESFLDRSLFGRAPASGRRLVRRAVHLACPTPNYLCAHWWIPFHTWVSSFGSITGSGGLGWNLRGIPRRFGCVRPVITQAFSDAFSTNFVTAAANASSKRWHPRHMGHPIRMVLRGKKSFKINLSGVPGIANHFKHVRITVHFSVVASLYNEEGKRGVRPHLRIRSSWRTQVFKHGRKSSMKAVIEPGILLAAYGPGVSKPAIGGLLQQPGTAASGGIRASATFTGVCPNFTASGNAAALLFQVGGVDIGNNSILGVGFNDVVFRHVR